MKFKDLKKTKVIEEKNEEQKELIDYLREGKENLLEENRELTKEKIELEKKLLSSDLEIAQANNEIEEKEKQIELLEDRIKYLEKAIKQYQQMPDLKNMIDNLSALTNPSIDKLAQIMKDNNFENLTNLEDKIDKVDEYLHHLTEEIYRSRPHFRAY